MDEQEIERLARDIEELKAAVKKNDPLLREVLTRKGWFLLGLVGGIGVALFALPAHFLTRAYGSFEAVPDGWKAFIWAALVLAALGGGVGKLLLINRRVVEVDRGSNLADLMGSFFGAASIHVTGAMLIAILVAVAFAVASGSPWHALPAVAIVMGIWMNAVGSQNRIREYLVAGWWSLATGSVGIFLVSRAPFLWVFAIFGGMFLAFAASIALSGRGPGRGRPGGGA